MRGGRYDERGGLLAPIGMVLAALALGVAGGYVGGVLAEPAPLTIDTTPMQAASPSVPTTPYSPDVRYPSWRPGLTYRRATIGQGGFAWTYDVPRGWTALRSGPTEIKWGVPGHPTGTFGMRIELVSGEHLTVAQEVAAKLAAMRSTYADVQVLEQRPDLLAMTYRSLPENWLRYNTFQWFAAPGTSTAAVELSVNGRTQDQAGMNDLLDHVAASLASR